LKWDVISVGWKDQEIQRKNLAEKTDGNRPTRKPTDGWIFMVAAYRGLLENCCKPQNGKDMRTENLEKKY